MPEQHYRIGYYAGGEIRYLDSLYTKEEAERQIATANLVETEGVVLSGLAGPHRIGSTLSRWFCEPIEVEV